MSAPIVIRSPSVRTRTSFSRDRPSGHAGRPVVRRMVAAAPVAHELLKPTARMSTFLHDFRVAVRQLAGHPSFTVVVVTTLALGIGATTTGFAVLNAIAFRPIPFADPDRLVAVYAVDRRDSGRSRLSLDTETALKDTSSFK